MQDKMSHSHLPSLFQKEKAELTKLTFLKKTKLIKRLFS